MDDEGNLLVAAVIALAAYGAFDLLRRALGLLSKWQNARSKMRSKE